MSEQSRLRLDPDHWEQRYVDGSIPWDTGEPDPHLRHFLSSFAPAPCKTLEIGCGTGTNATWLQSLGFEVTGIDVSATAIERSRVRAREEEQACRLEVADLRDQDIPGGPFQLAYDRGCFHLFEDQDSSHFAGRIAHHLGMDGLWCSLLGSTDGPPRETGPPRRSATAIMAAIEPHFEVLELMSCFFDEGSHSDARAWLLVARKRTP